MMKQPVPEVKAGDILAAFRQTRKIFSQKHFEKAAAQRNAKPQRGGMFIAAPAAERRNVYSPARRDVYSPARRDVYSLSTAS
ncbi:MAG: hypothetical protein JO360_05120 [Acidobacteria bacterium]|nr:hypothetical protein [Acidobacteriota bacterium]